MMNKFAVGDIGLPSRVKGVSVPMDASVSSLGKMIQFNPYLPSGVSQPYQSFTKIRPRAPVYRNIPKFPNMSGFDPNASANLLAPSNFFNAFV